MTEEIILESHYGNDSVIQPPSEENRIINAECRSALYRKKRILNYRLINEKFIEVTLTQGKKQETSSSIFHISFLSPEVKKRYELTWLWLYTFLIFVLLGTLSYFLLSLSYTIITALVALISFVLFARSFHSIFYFESINAKAPLLSLSKKYESDEKIKSLLYQVPKNIRKHPLPSRLNILAEEVKVLRELSEASIINEDEYHYYRDYLLKQFNKNK